MSGYIGPQPVPQATQHREAFTATASQTSFATAGYTPQFIDVYLNGVKLAPADYTATNGSDIVLTTGAAASDILEYVAYTPFEVANQTFTGTTTLTDSGAAPLVVNRTTSDGAITTYQKDGVTVGSIGYIPSGLYIDGETGHSGLRFGGADISPRDGGADADAAIQLGASGARFTDLYLSGGVYLGGTGAANKLDFYEEGIFTPTCTAFSAVIANGYYRLINDTCFVWLQMSNISSITAGAVQISLPFTSSADQGIGLAGSAIANRNNVGVVGAYVGNSASVATFLNTTTTDSALTQFSGANIFGASAASFAIYVSLKYRIA
tara:strand:+ start:17 stop:982 length:966 start_codon:yes stop_codon:yes gene_type:complete